MSELPTEASFLKDVARHEMTVRRDDGLYRHILFCDPKSGNMHFNVTTWPGYLCFSGDMGCYVFERIPDMLEFFRREDPAGDGGLAINPGYWGEKIQAADRHGGMDKFSGHKFKAAVYRHMEDGEWPSAARDAAEEEVLPHADDEHEAMRAAIEFEHAGCRFDDFWEYGLREVSCRFLWCCYALAWAVRQYDGRPRAEGVADGL